MLEKIDRAIKRLAANERRDSAEICYFFLALLSRLDRLNLAVTTPAAAAAKSSGKGAWVDMARG